MNSRKTPTHSELQANSHSELPSRPANNILYIDLNSCFASIEQQARPMLRGKPIAIVNRISPNACIITCSYEAKACGVKVGMRRREAEHLCKQQNKTLIFAESEPSKYLFVHQKFKQIMSDYSSHVTMKSIDEGVIDLNYAPENIKNHNRQEIGLEIKERLRAEIGCAMRCNVGIASNRFLAKLAGELHKPDGLDEITPENQREIFKNLKLTDLPGINVHMEARLNAVSIFTPLEFLDTDEETLVKMVCKSIDGHKWYQRLHGIEVDDVASEIKTIGRQYVLESNKLSRQEILARLIHLAEDVGYRLRSKQLFARGVYVWINTHSGAYLHHCFLSPNSFNTNHDIISIARQLFAKFSEDIQAIGISLYKLQEFPETQASLFEKEKEEAAKLYEATDNINSRFGLRAIHSADTLGTEKVKVKVPFGSTRYLDNSLIQ